MQLIATRHYDDCYPASHEKAGVYFDLSDKMYRLADGSFVLRMAGELPGDPEVVKPYSLEAVFAWFRDVPEQIERAVIGGRE